MWRGEQWPRFDDQSLSLIGCVMPIDPTKCVILVDNSNVYIEGSKYSARKKGVFKQSEFDKTPLDPSWRLEFGDLISALSCGREPHEAILVGSRPPANDKIWEAAKNGGFKVTTHERGSNNKEKCVDTELLAQGTEIICDSKEIMTLVIASGDRDFVPLVNIAKRRGWKVEMAAFPSAFRVDGELAMSVHGIVYLDSMFDKIGYFEYEWPRSC